jgi:endoglucanase
VRCSACWLAALLLISVSMSHAQVGRTEAKDRSVRSDLATSDWKKNLAVGPNGPIPAIVVDQFGYPTKSKKIAVIRDPQVGYDNSARFEPSKSYALIEIPTGKIVKMAPPAMWNGGSTDEASGDKAWWFDFSEIEQPGRYAVVDIEKGIRSADFSIGEHVYKEVMKHALRVFFYQRVGFEKKPEFAGRAWADKASHLGPGQDAEARPWHEGRLSNAFTDSQTRDLHGGWYDAGDFNKYTSWAARYIIVLLRAYEENSEAFSDDYGIPESGNGIPDILDEVKWGLDWLVRMQNSDGSLLCVQGLDGASPPSAAKGRSYYGPPTTSATLMGAAAFAYASKFFASRPEPDLKRYGSDLKERATAAWTWAIANPRVLYYNNDETRQPGSKGLASGQQEMSENDRLRAQFEAATYLLEVTGDTQFKEFADANYGALLPAWGASMWEVDALESMLYYARLPGATPEVAKSIRGLLVNLSRGSEAFQISLQRTDPYRAPMRDYTWGSNKGKTMQARLYQLVASYSADPRLSEISLAAALEYAHYIDGVNPLGLVYLTNMAPAGASHSAATMFHTWFAHGTRWQQVTEQLPGPPPGFLVGGPNPQFSIDACCSASVGSPGYRCYGATTFSLCQRNFTPPLAQPAAKSYLQFNDSWPANSWAVSEPSLYYQSYYVRLLAAFTR